MKIMVDELHVWPGARPPFHNGSCHLMITPGANIDELHRFATKIGLMRRWFQGHALFSDAYHYDLTPRMREIALLAGAEFVPARQQARERIAYRRAIK